MNSTNTSFVGMLTGDQVVDVIKALSIGITVLLLAYGAYNSGYSLQFSKDGLNVSLNPEKSKY